SRIGGGFLTDLDKLQELKNHLDETTVQQFNAIKLEKKKQLCAIIEEKEGVKLDANFLFDVQVKRLHEYKRQLMNALSVMDIYLSIKDGSLRDFTPTVFLFGAKAAPGYRRAKAVIRFINRMAWLINNDPAVHDLMKVVFVQNYNCSYAEHIIPAADISEQISPAGTEASGTGNMKLMLNGAVTLGTMDGANVEIVEQAGLENNYIFGATVDEINAIRGCYRARDRYEQNPNLRRAVDTLVDGTIETDEELHELHRALLDGMDWHMADHYFVLHDFASYQQARLQANRDYRDQIAFGRKCLMNTASAGKFSSDRTIRQYASEIWHIG
ncbi:MAG: glycogen/starch/alpha-glucan phosphorylase, partial [Oscillospiraceae bacterium]|nr:glycogen/starch/alpha-glucan phosphorylase [Oscillospiraceae bacterium]